MDVRTAALVLVLTLLVLTGCTWSTSEPGLLRGGETAETTSPTAPPPTNPALPVAGETTWTSAEGQRVTVRIAVHAIRRATGMTVLDWSITPLSAPDRRPGDEVPPGFDVALDRSTAGGVSMVLLDPRTRKAYRPLSHKSRSQAHGCLCTPIWAVQPTLRLGETRLLQVAFPPLPTGLRFVDVAAATLPPFSHVPVSAAGWVPTATHPADLARPAEPVAPLTAPQFFQTDDGDGDASHGDPAGGRGTGRRRIDHRALDAAVHERPARVPGRAARSTTGGATPRGPAGDQHERGQRSDPGGAERPPDDGSLDDR